MKTYTIEQVGSRFYINDQSGRQLTPLMSEAAARAALAETREKVRAPLSNWEVPGYRPVPEWALEIARKEIKDGPVILIWNHRRGIHTTGVAYNPGWTFYAHGARYPVGRAIRIREGRDASHDETLFVLLHEIAHLNAGPTAKHGPAFVREAMRLYRKYGLVEYAAKHARYAGECKAACKEASLAYSPLYGELQRTEEETAAMTPAPTRRLGKYAASNNGTLTERGGLSRAAWAQSSFVSPKEAAILAEMLDMLEMKQVRSGDWSFSDLTTSDLAEVLDCSVHSVNGTMSVLLAKGLVRTEKHGKTTTVFLTEKGACIAQQHENQDG